MNRPEIAALTGIRLLAALYVVLFHIGYEMVVPAFPDLYPLYKIICNGGWLGVDLFFLLSGFILSYNYQERFQQNGLGDYRNFICKRFARIYPVHLSTLILLMGCIAIRSRYDASILGAATYSAESLIKNLFMVHAWDAPIEKTWNTVSWSISAEWLMYLCFPFILPLTRRLDSSTRILVAMALVHLVMLGFFDAYEFKGMMAYGLFRVIGEFVMGVMLFRLFLVEEPRTEAPEIRPQRALLIGLCFYLSFNVLSPFSIAWAVPIFAWVILRVAQDRFIFNAFLSRSWVVYGGKISFSLYMVHGLVFKVSNGVLLPTVVENGALALVGYIAFCLTLSLGLSILVYRYIEEPCRNGLLSLARRGEVIQT
jgi:peptidoglycan/LPS O-acetylase OafA/YrhL